MAVCLGGVLWAACSGTGTTENEERSVSVTPPAENGEVTVEVLKRRAFEHELVSNGKVEAGRKADLRFESEGVVSHIRVKNGDRVQKGQILAELDKFRLSNQTAQTRDALEQAKLELKDVLIGQGYSSEEQGKVPEEVMQLARVKSGYDRALAQYELARYEEEHATLKAPFDGVVTNLFLKEHNAPDTSEPFCTLVGTQGMEVNFTVLENELPLIREGDVVEVTPYADISASCEGRISEVNPTVDEKGLVKVRATVSGKIRLFSGMNVRIHVHRSLPGHWVVPKSAVVLRSGKQVIFTLKQGKARWNYVQTGLENSCSYSLTDTGEMAEGDTVIVSGNMNLAHDVPVKVKNSRP